MESHKGEGPRDIRNRTFSFAAEVVNLCRKIESYSDVYPDPGHTVAALRHIDRIEY